MSPSSSSPLTAQQHAALTTRSVSVALSAGAGCGKTFVLTERLLSHLELAQPNGARTELSNLVAITFTDRAAREMRDRVRSKCHQRLLTASEDQAEHWLALLRELDTARISTIHAFCASLLRSNAVEAGLDPHFAILDPAQSETLLTEVIDDELRRLLAARDEATTSLAVRYGLNRMRDLVRDLMAERHRIEFDHWLRQSPAEIVARWQSYHRDVVLPALLRTVTECPPATELLELLRQYAPRNEVMRGRCEQLLALLPALSTSRDPCGDLDRIVEQARVQGGGGKSVWDAEEIYNRVKDCAEVLRKLAGKLRESAVFDPHSALPAAEAGCQLLQITAPIAAAYDRRKRDLASLDFDDLLTHARVLLMDVLAPDVRRRLTSQIHLLLVDEFQDTDPVQVDLVRALCDGDVTGGKLFFVGDFKQSIYRFRRADPHVFRQLRGDIPPAGRLPLTLNFRSQPAILQFVNALFHDVVGDDYEPLRPYRSQLSPVPVIEFLWAPADDPTVETTADLRRREAQWIARRLRSLLDDGQPLIPDSTVGGALRPLRPGDIALLFRALSDVQFYEQALREHEIEYYLVGGHAFYAQQEIFDLLNLLRALESRCDEISLAGAMRSPFFSLSDETLYWLAQRPGGLAGGLFSDQMPAELDREQSRRAAFARDTLNELRAHKDRWSITRLIHEALARTGYDAVLVAEFLGERKLANLRKLIDQARTFDRGGLFTLADFITQVSEFVANQPKEPLAATQPEATDVVRLMTIHQSKGLEFPVVVVPDVDRPRRVGGPGAAFSPELGPLVRLPAEERNGAGPSGYDLFAKIEDEEDQAELVRLFYVATTRAADYLLVSGGVPRLGSTKGPWTQLLAQRFDLLSGRTCCDLPPGYEGPAVRVTSSEPPEFTPSKTNPRRRELQEVIERVESLASAGDGELPKLAAAVPPDPSAQRRYSFSRLTGGLHVARSALEVEDAPNADDATVDPRGLGTLVHAVLAQIAWGKEFDVRAEVERHAESHVGSSQADIDTAVRLINRLLRSDRAKSLASARQVHPELEFLLAWKLPHVYLQGYIDCLYEDQDGKWHLLDYKTNNVKADTVPAAAAAYEMQMLVYALAAEQSLGHPLTSIRLHFLRPGVEFSFQLDAAARGRLEKMVNQRLEAMVATARLSDR